VCRCRECGTILLFTIDTVHGHVSSMHKMNWGTYKARYLSQDDPPVKTERASGSAGYKKKVGVMAYKDENSTTENGSRSDQSGKQNGSMENGDILSAVKKSHR
jgi:hypothetical protein